MSTHTNTRRSTHTRCPAYLGTCPYLPTSPFTSPSESPILPLSSYPCPGRWTCSRRPRIWLANTSTSIRTMCRPGTTTSPRYRDVMSSLILSLLSRLPAVAAAAASATCCAVGWRYSYVCCRTRLLSFFGFRYFYFLIRYLFFFHVRVGWL